MLDTIAAEAASESSVWADALLPAEDRRDDLVFSTLAPAELALGLETVYEGYLVHYGRSRLFTQADSDVALLLGDYLYACGLVRVAATGNVEAVVDLAELISLCAQSRADARAGDGDGVAWAATAARIGQGGLVDGRDALRLERDAGPLEASARAAAGHEAVDRALAAHEELVGYSRAS